MKSTATACAAALACAVAATAQEPALDHAAYSPGGDRMSWYETGASGSAIVVAAKSGDAIQIERRFGVGDLNVVDVAWAGATHVLVTYAFTDPNDEQRQFKRLYAIDIATGAAAPMLQDDSRLGANLDLTNVVAATSDSLLIPASIKVRNRRTTSLRRNQRNDLLKVAIASGEIEDTEAPGDEDTVYWMPGADGGYNRVDFVRSSGRIFVRKSEGDDWETVGDYRVESPQVRFVGFDAANRAPVARVTDPDSGGASLLLFSGSAASPIFSPAEGETLGAAITDPASGAIVGVEVRGGERRQVFFDDDLVATQDYVATGFPDQTVRIDAWSPDRSEFVLDVTGADDTRRIYLFAPESGRAMALGRGIATN